MNAGRLCYLRWNSSHRPCLHGRTQAAGCMPTQACYISAAHELNVAAYVCCTRCKVHTVWRRSASLRTHRKLKPNTDQIARTRCAGQRTARHMFDDVFCAVCSREPYHLLAAHSMQGDVSTHSGLRVNFHFGPEFLPSQPPRTLADHFIRSSDQMWWTLSC